MKYHNHYLKKVIDVDVIGGHYYEVYRLEKCQFKVWGASTDELDKRRFHIDSHGNVFLKIHITDAWSLSNAKEFVNTFNGVDYNYNVLA